VDIEEKYDLNESKEGFGDEGEEEASEDEFGGEEFAAEGGEDF
jgi:hypothetical protein